MGIDEETSPFGISDADSAILLEAFDNSSLFSENEELLANLREISTVIKVGPSWTLLAQGEFNVRLYVLLAGSVEVFVDEKLVAHLRRKGDFLGEMGVITGQPNSATVITATPCEFLCIDIENSQGGEPNPIVRQALHSLFARALANKLVITNERAKKFESASEELRRAHDALRAANLELEEKVRVRTQALVQKREELEAQNAEIGASMQKLQELVLTKDKTFSSLNILRSDYLEPLQTLLMEPDPSADANLQAKRRLLARLGDLLENLRPMTDVHQSEVALRHKRVVLAISNKKLQRIAKIALLGTGVNLEILPPDASPATVLDTTVDIVLTDVEHLDAVQESHARHPEMDVVFMTPDSIEVYLHQVSKHTYLSNIVSFNIEDRDFTTKNILTTVSKILNRDIFGLEKYLLWGVDVEQRPNLTERSAQRAHRWHVRAPNKLRAPQAHHFQGCTRLRRTPNECALRCADRRYRNATLQPSLASRIRRAPR